MIVSVLFRTSRQGLFMHILKIHDFLFRYWSKNVERYTKEKNLEVIHSEDNHVYINIGKLQPENVTDCF